MPRKVLYKIACDSSSNRTSVTLVRGESCIETLGAFGVSDHASTMAGIVQKLLSVHNVPPTEVVEFIVGAGPGSFTGLRVALSFAKGFCLATGAKLVLVPTLQAIALPHLVDSSELVVGVSDARRREFFVGGLARGASGRLYTALAPQTVAEDSLEELVLGVAASAGINQVVFASAEGELLPETSVKINVTSQPLSELLFKLRCELLPGDVREAGSPAEIAALTPCYVREVAAKSISERGVS